MFTVTHPNSPPIESRKHYADRFTKQDPDLNGAYLIQRLSAPNSVWDRTWEGNSVSQAKKLAAVREAIKPTIDLPIGCESGGFPSSRICTGLAFGPAIRVLRLRTAKNPFAIKRTTAATQLGSALFEDHYGTDFAGALTDQSSNTYELIGSRFTPPAPGQNLFHFTRYSNYLGVYIKGGNLPAPLSVGGTIGPGNRVLSVDAPLQTLHFPQQNLLIHGSMVFSSQSGLVTGAFLEPLLWAGTQTVSPFSFSQPFRGVVFQKLNFAAGVFDVSPGVTVGSVMLTPQ